MPEPRSISNIVRDLTKGNFGSKDALFGKLLSEWSNIVGDEIASKAIPTKLAYLRKKDAQNQADLHLAVKSAYAVEFAYQKTLLLERLNVFFGYKAINDIRITQYSSITENKPKVKTTTAKPDAAKLGEIDKKIAVIEEKDLQTALKNLGTSLLSRNNCNTM